MEIINFPGGGTQLERFKARLKGFDWSSFLAFISLLSVLLVFMLWPLASVLHGAFMTAGGLSLTNFQDFFAMSYNRKCVMNTILVGFGSVLTSSLIGIPLAFIMARHEFPGKKILQLAATLPIIMPPFVGALAMLHIFGKHGIINLFLRDICQFFNSPHNPIDIRGNLFGVLLVQTIHLYPLIYLNCHAALMNIDPSLEESAKNLGADSISLFQTVTFPLMLPGYAAGALLVFVWSLSDLGTPLMLGYWDLLAPSAFRTITQRGLADPAGYVICVLLAGVSLGALATVRKFVSLRQYAIVSSGVPQSVLAKRALGKRLVACLTFVIFVVILSLLPHFGIIVMSFAKVWSFSYLPEKYTLEHYSEILFNPQSILFIKNTLIYCSLSMLFDIIIGSVVAYLLVRKRFPAKNLLDVLAMLPFAVPGIAFGIGYLRVFYPPSPLAYFPGIKEPLARLWIILPIAYAIRRLPYTVRSCYASLQQIHVSLEEASMNLGANRIITFLRVTLPLMMGGIVAGGTLAFANAAIEVSTTLLLAWNRNIYPMSWAIYMWAYDPRGYGKAAGEGVLLIILVAASIVITNKVFGRRMGILFRV